MKVTTIEIHVGEERFVKDESHFDVTILVDGKPVDARVVNIHEYARQRHGTSWLYQTVADSVRTAVMKSELVEKK